jgi:hypothetical protein
MVTEVNEILESDPSQEDESDLGATLGTASLSSSDWTVETILNQMRRGNIQLNPGFQRRDAWTDVRKSVFVESLMLGLPIPQLVLAEHKTKRGNYIVIDGKQRLLTLRRFSPPALDGADGQVSPLVLTGLKSLHELNGRTYNDLANDPQFSEFLTEFDNQTIRTVVVRQWPSEEYLYTVFYRLNTGSVPLSPQELRQALHRGRFLTFAEEYSAASRELQRALRINGPDFRMRDVEILVRYFGFAEFLPEYRGNLKQFLDMTANKLNQAWPQREVQLRQVADACESAIRATFDIFGDHAFERWSGDKYEPRFNRAVFDIMTYYFKDEAIARLAMQQREPVRARFERLCVEDADFRESIQTTTKSVTATFKRLKTWGDTLVEITGLDFRRPQLIGKRMRV